MDDKMREAFEAWAGLGDDEKHPIDGYYLDQGVRVQWFAFKHAYQAALQSPEVGALVEWFRKTGHRGACSINSEHGDFECDCGFEKLSRSIDFLGGR